MTTRRRLATPAIKRIDGKHAPGTCRICLCTDDRACAVSCTWVDGEAPTLCSTCEWFRHSTRAEVLKLIVAAGYSSAGERSRSVFEDGVICLSAQLDGLRALGYELVRAAPWTNQATPR